MDSVFGRTPKIWIGCIPINYLCGVADSHQSLHIRRSVCEVLLQGLCRLALALSACVCDGCRAIPFDRLYRMWFEERGSSVCLPLQMGALSVSSDGSDQKCFDGELTFLGRVLAHLPLDLHLGKLIVLGHAFGCLEECLIIGLSPTQWGSGLQPWSSGNLFPSSSTLDFKQTGCHEALQKPGNDPFI